MLCTVTSWACIGIAAALKYFDGFNRCAGRGINTWLRLVLLL